MSITSITKSGIAGKINLLALVVAIIIVLVLPVRKEIWYDETISILCSKGISHDLQYQLGTGTTTNSDSLAQYNTAAHVFDATVKDNANSYLYNITLHWFTDLFGNGLNTYVLLSKLCGIATLLAFFMLCSMVLGKRVFTSVAVLLLATDVDFLGMSHEIRAYAMGITFVTLAAVYFFKYINGQDKPLNLFFIGLFSVGAVLSHFLSVYIVLVLLGGLLYFKKTKLFTGKNIVAMAIPVALIAFFFLLAYPGLDQMSKQNHDIQVKSLKEGFSIVEVLTRSMKFFAMNYKAVFPAFTANIGVYLLSAGAIVALYVAGLRSAVAATDRRNLHLLFLMGTSSSVFLALLCVKSHHYTALYFRYFSFCLPFACLFTALALQLIFRNARFHMAAKGTIATIIVLPSIAFFVITVRSNAPVQQYNHMVVANEIVTEKTTRLGVPRWKDAFMVHCFLPAGYKIDYVRNELAPYFTLYNAGTEKHIPVAQNSEQGSK